MTIKEPVESTAWRVPVGWLLVAAWVAWLLTPFVVAVPTYAVMVGSMLILVAFGFVHGSGRYGVKGVALFFVALALVSNLFETTSIAAGFPFGFYQHHASMGPKLFLVPIVIGPGYFGYGYLAWTVANALLGEPDRDQRGGAWIALAIASAFIVTGFDAVQDPGGATVRHDWTYRYGGGYYGVPLSNFGGWLFTTLVAFLFAGWLLRRFAPGARPGQPLGWWLQPMVLVVLQPLPSLLAYLFVPGRMESDATGAQWNTLSIAEGTVIVGIVSCMAFGIIAGLLRWRQAEAFRPGA